MVICCPTAGQAQQYLRSTAQTGPGSLDAELERIPAEDGKELLRRSLKLVGCSWFLPKWEVPHFVAVFMGNMMIYDDQP